MMAKKITVIPGDGIGQEITEETVRVLGKIDEIYKIANKASSADQGTSF